MMKLRVDYDNQKCTKCGQPLERPKRTNTPKCMRCQGLGRYLDKPFSKLPRGVKKKITVDNNLTA